MSAQDSRGRTVSRATYVRWAMGKRRDPRAWVWAAGFYLRQSHNERVRGVGYRVCDLALRRGRR
jgi:hypothetical protein